jgi:hypothetical protein
MYKNALKVALAWVLVSVVQVAHAFVDPPLLVPTNLAAGQTISIDITAGVCDAFTTDPATIARSGNSIHMTLQAVSAPPASDFCIYPTGTYAFAVGAFDPGVYLLQVDRVYIGPNGLVTQTLGVLPFAVAGPASLPALDPFGAVGQKNVTK